MTDQEWEDYINSGSSDTGSSGTGTSLTDYIKGVGTLGTTATGILGALSGKKTTAATTSSSFTQYLPWIIGGAVLLLILAVVLGRR